MHKELKKAKEIKSIDLTEKAEDLIFSKKIAKTVFAE